MHIGAGEHCTLIELRAAVDSVIDKLAQNEMGSLDQVQVSISMCRDSVKWRRSSTMNLLSDIEHDSRTYSFHFWSLDM